MHITNIVVQSTTVLSSIQESPNTYYYLRYVGASDEPIILFNKYRDSEQVSNLISLVLSPIPGDTASS